MEKTVAKTEKEPEKLTKPKIAMLIMALVALIFIMAFSCYGCSYQNLTPPDEQEAQDSFKSMYATTWKLDKQGDASSLSEMNNMEVASLAFSNAKNEEGFLSTILGLTDFPSLTAQLGFRQDYGFYLRTNGKDLPIKVTYSSSKDGKTETITLMGEESNIYCYYLKQ
ncbi:hypothetical protein [uncultured Sphaerochaeta sp.]|uniref:hypothetical protein n=1 Tax=uncultured Sphaerochaeta sp. TaxID=886478 RepID=UPI002A0A44E6|nr:hypothetical protein [uncultured Sphaerochaeta sp.]